jgi:hypothetical protein
MFFYLGKFGAECRKFAGAGGGGETKSLAVCKSVISKSASFKF